MNSPAQVNELVEANIKLAHFFANKAADIDPDEALSRALQGLQKAAETFDSSKGKFSTHASWKIKAALGRYRQDQSCVKRGGRAITVSLNDLVGEDGTEIRDFIADDSADNALSEICKDDNKQILATLLTKLPSKLRDVLVMRFGLNGDEPHTLEQAGEIIGVTREYIRQLQIKAIAKLSVLYRERENNGERKPSPLLDVRPLSQDKRRERYRRWFERNKDWFIPHRRAYAKKYAVVYRKKYPEKTREAVRKWRRKHPEKVKAFLLNNRPRILALRRQDYQKRREFYRQKSKAFYWKFKTTKIAESRRKYYLANREKLNIKAREWARANAEKVNARRREIAAQKRAERPLAMAA